MKLKAPKGRVIVRVDLEYKNSHTFSDGSKIRLERGFDNFNLRYTSPVNAIVVSSNYIPEGAELLIHHNATHDTHRIFNYRGVTEESSSSVKYYSIPETECYLWRKDSNVWNPCNNFDTGLRLFRPIKTTLIGLKPTKIKERLYVTSGKLKGQVAITLKASDYEIIYQNTNGTEDRIIRFRHYPEGHERNEVIGVDHELTKQVKKGDVFVGLDCEEAKSLKEYLHI